MWSWALLFNLRAHTQTHTVFVNKEEFVKGLGTQKSGSFTWRKLIQTFWNWILDLPVLMVGLPSPLGRPRTLLSGLLFHSPNSPSFLWENHLISSYWVSSSLSWNSHLLPQAVYQGISQNKNRIKSGESHEDYPLELQMQTRKLRLKGFLWPAQG